MRDALKRYRKRFPTVSPGSGDSSFPRVKDSALDLDGTTKHRSEEYDEKRLVRRMR